MNRPHDITVKVGASIALVALLFSCQSHRMSKAKIRQSPVLDLYSYIEYNREKELLLRMPSKSYIYYEKYYGIEIGNWQRKEDSLFLYPKMYINDDLNKCKKIDRMPLEYFIDTSLVNFSTPFRLFIYINKNKIVDYTLEHYHVEDLLEDEDSVYLQEIHEPLIRREIKATKIEKDVMMRRWLYGGSFFHCD